MTIALNDEELKTLKILWRGPAIIRCSPGMWPETYDSLIEAGLVEESFQNDGWRAYELTDAGRSRLLKTTPAKGGKT